MSKPPPSRYAPIGIPNARMHSDGAHTGTGRKPRETAGSTKQAVKRALIASLGRPVRCELCGEVLFRGLPIVRGGRVKLIGAEYALIRVDFASMNHLSFRHVEADRCAMHEGKR